MSGDRGNEEWLLPDALTVVKGGVPGMANGATIHADAALLDRWQYTPNHVIGDAVRAYAASIVGARTRLIQLLTWQQQHGHQTVCDAAGVAYRQSEQASAIYSASHWGLYMAAAWVHARRTDDTEVLDMLAWWWRAMLALWCLFELPDGRVMVVAPRTRKDDPFDPIAQAILAVLRGRTVEIRYERSNGDVTESRPTWVVWAVKRLDGWPDAVEHVVRVPGKWKHYIPRLEHPIWERDTESMALDLPRTKPGRVSWRRVVAGHVWCSEEPPAEYPPGGVVYGAREGAPVPVPVPGPGPGPAPSPAPSPTPAPTDPRTSASRTLPDADEIKRLSSLPPSLIYGATRFNWHLDAGADTLSRTKPHLSQHVSELVQYATRLANLGDWSALVTLRELLAKGNDGD